MKRRNFLKSTVTGIPGLLLFPSILQSCKDQQLFEGLAYDGKVVIVGAGISGLYAAHLLRKQGIDVEILEASSGVGGRMRSLENFADFPVELGAEEVHGELSAWFNLLSEKNVGMSIPESNDLFYIGNTLRTEEQASLNGHFNHITELLANLDSYSGSDVSAAQFAIGENVNEAVAHIWNAWVGNEYGTSNENLSMLGLSQAENNWTAGENNYQLTGSDFSQFITSYFKDEIALTQFNRAIDLVQRTGGKTKLYMGGEVVAEADKVILTVPHAILRDGLISFEPVLPASKISAFSKIGMDRGIKIVIKFNTRFWPQGTGSIYGPGLIPEFWDPGLAKGGNDAILIGFVNGPNAEFLATQVDSIVDIALEELDALFGDVTSQYHSHFIMDWGADPFIRGAYSYPEPGSSGAREILAAPIDDQLFFAGEATHTGGHFGTVHGAMESSLRAVIELLQSVKA